jgi:hypothetical protein
MGVYPFGRSTPMYNRVRVGAILWITRISLKASSSSIIEYFLTFLITVVFNFAKAQKLQVREYQCFETCPGV